MKVPLRFQGAIWTTIELCRNGECHTGSPRPPESVGATEIDFALPGIAGGGLYERQGKEESLIELSWTGPHGEGDSFQATVTDRDGVVLAMEGGTAHFPPAPADDACNACEPGVRFGEY